VRPDIFLQSSQHGIILEQVRQRFGVRQIVHRYEFDIAPVQGRPDHISTDTAEAIDTNLYSHFFS
jgi:hypothetical protein